MDKTYTFGDVLFEPDRGELVVAGRRTRLRPQTGAVLAFLLDRPRQVVTKDELLREVWRDIVVTENSLSQCVREIRRELGDAQETLLRTVPRRGYLLDTDVAVADRAAAAPARDKRFTILVLPLVTVGGDPEQEYFAEGLTEDLTTDLGRIPNGFVISRGTANTYRNRAVDIREIGRELGVRFVVEGSVRRNGDDVLVNLRLSETADAGQIWAERFEARRTELAALQRSMAGRVALAMAMELVDAEAARIERANAPNPDAHDLAMRAFALWRWLRKEDNARARALAEEALRIDPECVLALVILAHTHITDLALRWTTDTEASIAAAEAAAGKAVKLDPYHRTANTPWGIALVYRKRFEEALGVFETQLSLNSSFMLAHQWTGITHVLMGNPRLAIAPFERAVELNPRARSISTTYSNIAVAYLHAGEDEQALTFAERSIRLPDPWARSYERLAAVYGCVGLVDDARAAVEVLLRRWPGYSIAQHRAEMISDRPAFLAQRARYIDGLRIAGLPEA